MKRPRCSFCGKSRDDVSAMISGPSVYICDECVYLASVQITKEWEKISRELSRPPAPAPTTPTVHAEQQLSGPRFVRVKEVIRRTGFSRATVYLRMRQGRFPMPVQLGSSHAVAWLESEIDAWIATTVHATREEPVTLGK